jgi:hypothetical protein
MVFLCAKNTSSEVEKKMKSILKRFLKSKIENEKNEKDQDQEQEKKSKEWLSHETRKKIEQETLRTMSRIEKAIIRHF